MGDAVAVGDDERGAGITFRLAENTDRVAVLGTERDARDIDRAVGRGDQAKVLLRHRLAGHAELRDRAERGGFRLLAAGVGVNLGVEHEDVHIAAGGDHVVEAAESDVVGPAVAADDPDALVHQVVGDLRERAGFDGVLSGKRLAHRDHALALGFDAVLGGLVGR